MWPLSERKSPAVKERVSQLLCETCPRLAPKSEDCRIDYRTHRVVVGMIIPMENREIQADQAITAVTKDFSNSGVAMLLKEPCALQQAILGFRLSGTMTFFRAEARHQEPIEGGFHQIGFQLFEIAEPIDYPGLESLGL